MQPTKYNPAWEHIKLLIWVVLIFELLLFGLALAVGKSMDSGLAFRVCFWIGLIIAVVFLAILLLNLLGIVTFSLADRIHAALFSRESSSAAAINPYDRPELKQILKNADHVDVKTVQGSNSLAEFISGMLSFRPSWLIFFYRIRKMLVPLLGLHQDAGPEMLTPLRAGDIPFQPGRKASFFTVRLAEKNKYWVAETPDEKHLQAFVGIFRQRVNQQTNNFHVMTVVHYKHWTGPVYFNIIRPFHHLVVKQMALAGTKTNQGTA